MAFPSLTSSRAKTPFGQEKKDLVKCWRAVAPNPEPLATVFVDGIDANLEQVKSGFAWVYSKYIDQAGADIQTSYRQAETQAWEQQRGLWIDPDPVPPWLFRKESKQPN